MQVSQNLTWISDFLPFKGSLKIDFSEWGWIYNEFSKTSIHQAQKTPLVEDGSGSFHTARYNSSLCDCQLLAKDFLKNPHSSMKDMYLNMASKMINVLDSHNWSIFLEGISKEMANKQEKQKTLLAQFVEKLIQFPLET